MPIRVDDDGKPSEAFYASVWIRVGKTGERPLPAVEHTLGGWEDTEELTLNCMLMVALAQKHFRSKGIGAPGIQRMLNWQWLVCRRLGLDTDFLVVDAKSTRAHVLVPSMITTEEDLAVKYVCEDVEGWYRKEHGNEIEHRAFVNAMTLSFRL